LLSTLLQLTQQQYIKLFKALIVDYQSQVLKYFIKNLQPEHQMSLLDDIVHGQQDSRKTFPTSEAILDLQINSEPEKLKCNWLVQRLCELASQMTKDQRQQLFEKIETWPSDVHHEHWFQLEDIADFSDRWVQMWFRDCSNEDLIIVLHDLGNHPLKEKLLINLSKRAAEMLVDDIEMQSKFGRVEIQHARQRLMRTARHMRLCYPEE
jgi:flagellar motor switch protein FliG